MAAAVTTAAERVSQAAWDAFDADREHLYDQYERVPYDPTTGRSPEELRRDLERLLTDAGDAPHVLVKARAMEHLLLHARLHVDPTDPFPDKLDHAGLLQMLRKRWHAEARQGALGEAAAWFETLTATGSGRASLDTGHISPGWETLFARGLRGLADEAARRLASCSAEEANRRTFCEAVGIVCEAAVALAQRFAVHAEALAQDAADDDDRARLEALAAVYRRVPALPPRTLHEALAFHWLMHELIELEGEAVRSLGHFDQLFYPYYRADLEAGRLTREGAAELFRYYWVKSYARTRGVHNGAHWSLGGQRADGGDAANELTYLLLDAYEALDAPDPKLSVRFHRGSPERLLRRVLALIRAGHNAVVLMNDDVAVPALVRRGKALEDARTYLPIGCYEPAVDGKEAACTTNLVVNLAKPVELLLHDGVDPLSGRQIGPRTGDPRTFRSFDEVRRAYLAQLDALIEASAAAVAEHERQWSRINPSPLIACTIDDCLALGRDIGEGGAHYNAVGCVGAGLANAADSLAALRAAVFDEGHLSMGELVAALDADFTGEEALRQYLLRKPHKWGNGDADVDALATEIADHYCAKIHAFTNERGGPYQAALYSFTFQWTLGEDTGALPDGRLAGAPLAPGVGAMAGRDTGGVTALLESVNKLDFSETPNGSVLDIRLHPRSVAGEAGLDALAALVRAAFSAGLFAVQFNVLDSATLAAAQRDPEAYATLQVRVAGYSAYFVRLDREMQNHLIAQLTHIV